MCITTTLWLSALSHVSIALQMLQILSRAGAWWSGQPKSRTWEREERQLLGVVVEPDVESGQRWSCWVYLGIELADVVTLLAEVEELKQRTMMKPHVAARPAPTVTSWQVNPARNPTR